MKCEHFTCYSCPDVKEHERDVLVAQLVKLFGWADESYLHAVMHVENAVNNLKAQLGTAEAFHDVAVKERDYERHRNNEAIKLIRYLAASRPCPDPMLCGPSKPRARCGGCQAREFLERVAT